MRALSPLRYPGGKWRIAPFIERLIQINGLVGREYVEPYAGGCSLALTLLEHEVVSRVHLNDLDEAVYSFWWSALNRPDDLVDLIRATPINPDEWQKQRSVYRDGLRNSRLQLGFSMLYLNRTNYSGIMNGGMIGGKAQAGVYTIDARFNRSSLVQRVTALAAKRDRISLYNEDAVSFVKRMSLSGDFLAYFDPPYYRAGAALYLNAYTTSDHSSVKAAVQSLSCPWIVSYDDVKEIRVLYKGVRNRKISLLHTARSSHVGKEVVFFSDALRIPRLKAPHVIEHQTCLMPVDKVR